MPQQAKEDTLGRANNHDPDLGDTGDPHTIYHPRDTNFQGEDLPEGPTHPIYVVRPGY